MCAKNYENPTMLSRITAKNVGDVFFETHCSLDYWSEKEFQKHTELFTDYSTSSYQNTFTELTVLYTM